MSPAKQSFRFRDARRVLREAPVRLSTAGEGADLVARTRDIAVGGMFVVTSDVWPVGAGARFALDLGAGDADTVRGEATVVWVRETPVGVDQPAGMGMQFTSVTPPGQDRLAMLFPEPRADAADSGTAVVAAPPAPAEPASVGPTPAEAAPVEPASVEVASVASVSVEPPPVESDEVEAEAIAVEERASDEAGVETEVSETVGPDGSDVPPLEPGGFSAAPAAVGEGASDRTGVEGRDLAAFATDGDGDAAEERQEGAGESEPAVQAEAGDEAAAGEPPVDAPQAPESEAPGLEAPETAAPEVSVPEVPETAAPEASGPEAPETAAPEALATGEGEVGSPHAELYGDLAGDQDDWMRREPERPSWVWPTVAGVILLGVLLIFLRGPLMRLVGMGGNGGGEQAPSATESFEVPAPVAVPTPPVEPPALTGPSTESTPEVSEPAESMPTELAAQARAEDAAVPSPDPATRSGEPATQAGEPASSPSGPATRSSDPATRAAEPASPSPAPATQAGEPATRSAAPAAQAGEPVSSSPAPATSSVEPTARSLDPASDTAARPSEPAERPRSPAPPPAAPASSRPLAAATALRSITASVRDDRTLVEILGNAPFERHHAMQLEAPPRLLVRLIGVQRDYDASTVSAPRLRGVRTGVHGRGATRNLHVVLDLAAPDVVATVERRGDRVVVSLQD